MQTFQRLREATGILIPPGNVKATAKAIEVSLRNFGLRTQLAKNAAEDTRIRFDLNRQVDEYLNWYKEILENWVQ